MRKMAGLFSALLVGAALASTAYAGNLGMRSSVLEGREVIGMQGQRLGYVLAVDDHARMIDLQTPGGIAVAVPESRLRLFDGNLVATNMTRKDVVAMERRQTGRTVAVNVDMGARRTRG